VTAYLVLAAVALVIAAAAEVLTIVAGRVRRDCCKVGVWVRGAA